MPLRLRRPITIKTELLPPSLNEFITKLRHADGAPWYWELEAIYQLIEPHEWAHVVKQYYKINAQYETKKAQGRPEDELHRWEDELVDSGNRLIRLYGARVKFLQKVESEREPSVAADEAAQRALSSLQGMLSPFSREEIDHSKKLGLDFDRLRAESRARAAPVASHQKPLAPPAGISHAPSPVPCAPSAAPPSERLVLPASLHSRLVPASLQELLSTMTQPSQDLWFVELERISNLVPTEQWRKLELQYEDLGRRLAGVRGGDRGQWDKLQEEMAKAWRGVLQERVKKCMSNLKAFPFPLSAEELAFYRDQGLDLSVPVQRSADQAAADEPDIASRPLIDFG